MGIDTTAEEQKQEAPKCPAPGLYQGIEYDEYESWDAVNASRLNGFSRTPAHVHYEMTHGGKERTPSLDLGWLVHVAVLEPDRYESGFVVPPKVDRRTKAGKAAWAEFTAANPDKEFVDADTWAKVNAMRSSLLEHPTAGEFFGGRGHNEVSVIWMDSESGVMCKARIDRVGFVGEWPIVGDLKTARNAARRPIERAIFDYGYDVQAAHYLAALEALYPVPAGNPFRRFVFFVIESEPPYLCACYELDDAALNEGEQKRRRYIAKWQRCVETGVWEGYPPGIEYASLPAWAFKHWEDV